MKRSLATEEVVTQFYRNMVPHWLKYTMHYTKTDDFEKSLPLTRNSEGELTPDAFDNQTLYLEINIRIYQRNRNQYYRVTPRDVMQCYIHAERCYSCWCKIKIDEVLRHVVNLFREEICYTTTHLYFSTKMNPYKQMLAEMYMGQNIYF